MFKTLRYVLRRLLLAIPVLICIAIINFLLVQAAPGDAVDVLAGEAGTATPEYVAGLRQQFGLDKPVYVRLAQYVFNIAQLDFGYSFREGRPVISIILARVPPTLLLLVASTLLAVGVGILLGAIAARFRNRTADAVISVVALLLYATPTFWIGLMMIVLFSVDWGILPSGGLVTIGGGHTGFAWVLDVAWHLVQPAVALSLFYLAVYARLTRATMIEAYGEDFVRTAIAKGLTSRRIALKHVLPNAILPTVTMAGVQIGSLLGGAVLVETVFSWPGIGRLAYEAVFHRDYNLLLGILLMTSAMVILLNLVVDLLYAWLDPRIEMR
jgi:peptide/nickel transport system permease protein